MFKIGVTERGDAGLDFSWIDKLYSANIIISKNLNDTLIDNLIKNKDKIIFHMTCTGYGNTILEPNVPNVLYNRKQIDKLIDLGFPVKQIVLRIDPIIPTDKGMSTVELILNMFKDSNIKRVRFSFLEVYSHIKPRFIKAGLSLPYNNFVAPLNMRVKAIRILKLWQYDYEFESCAEDTPYQLGCVSQKDLDILGLTEHIKVSGYQRKGCLCANNKTELLNNKYKCTHGCLYCYWKDK